MFGYIFFNATEENYFSNAIVDQLIPHAERIEILLVQEMMTAGLVKAVTQMALEVSRARDNETGGHLERMSSYARLIAAEGAKIWGLSDEFIEHLYWYAPLHDIGKVATPDAILLKPGKLTEAEWIEMQLHVVKGLEIIDGVLRHLTVDSLPYIGVARNIIAFHHENVDGSGYPHGTRGNQIPIEGRIIAVADVFDALTSDRPYKRKWSNEQAIDHLRSLIGTKFDGDCVQAFLRRIDQVVDIQTRFQ